MKRSQDLQYPPQDMDSRDGRDWGPDSGIVTSSPVSHLSFPVWRGLWPVPLVYVLPSLCWGGGRAAGTDSLHRALVHNLKCVTFRAFPVYFMQSGSCEGCELEDNSVSLGPQGDACGVVGSSCIPLFPQRGWTQVSLGWGGLLHFATGMGRIFPTLCPPNLGCTF